MSDKTPAITDSVVKEAMKAVAKDVRAPLVVRKGIVKSKSQNMKNKPDITAGEWKAQEDTFYCHKNDNRVIVEESSFIPILRAVAFGATKEQSILTGKMIALAGNLSQKYGSLEAMEQRLLRAEESDKNHYELWQQGIQIIDALDSENSMLQNWKQELTGQVKELREAASDFYNQSCGNFKLKSCGHDSYNCICSGDRLSKALQTTKE